MVNFISTLIQIALYPFTSGTYFVVIPCVILAICALIRLTISLIFAGMDKNLWN